MIAVLTGMDTHPARSIALMLKSVGFEVVMLSDEALKNLHARAYTGGVEASLLKSMGYVDAGIPVVSQQALETCDLFVDLKVRDADTMLKVYPRLVGKTVIFLINGGWDDYEDFGDHYPVVTSNFWVKQNAFKCYMPFDNLHNVTPREQPSFGLPIGLLHNAYNWGFRSIIDEVIAQTGLQVYGSYGSPAGMLKNDKVGDELKKSVCFIHLKASDCPGYALYEAFAAGVPVVVTELLIKRMRFDELYEDDVTCLTWGDGSYKLEDEKRIIEFIDASKQSMIDQISSAVERLKDPETNIRIGMAGHDRWRKLTDWTLTKRDSFMQFLKIHRLV